MMKDELLLKEMGKWLLLFEDEVLKRVPATLTVEGAQHKAEELLAKAKPILIKEGYKQGVADANKAEQMDIKEAKREERERIEEMGSWEVFEEYSEPVLVIRKSKWQALKGGSK